MVFNHVNEMFLKRVQVAGALAGIIFVISFIYSATWTKSYTAGVTHINPRSGSLKKIYLNEKVKYNRDTNVYQKPQKRTELHRFVYKEPIRARNLSLHRAEDLKYASLYGTRRSFFDSFIHGLRETDDTIVLKESYATWNKKWISLTDSGIDVLAQRKLHNVSTEDKYINRRKEIMDRCSQHTRNRHVDLSRMVYDDRHKTIMCVVPKAACTTWKRIMWYLMGKENNQSALPFIDPKLLVLNNGYISTLDKLSKTEALRRLDTYTTFFVMRQPYERLVSAYSSKFTDRSKATYMMRLGRWIALRQSSLYLHGIQTTKHRPLKSILDDPAFIELTKAEQEDVRKYVKVMETGQVSFQQFIRYILSEERSKPLYRWDVHWRPQLTLCNPCVVNYDYIVKFEDLAEDGNVLLEHLQQEDPPDRQIRLEPGKPWINDTVAKGYYDTLTNIEDRGIRKVYEKDLSLLGYS